MLNLQPPAEAGQTAAEGARKGFDAGEVIIEHVSNTSVGDPLIHLPKVFGIDMSVTKHVLMLWVVAAILFVGITWVVRRYLRLDRLIPGRTTSLLEVLIEFVRDSIAGPNLGNKWVLAWTPMLLTLFLFIFTANLMGVILVLSLPIGVGLTALELIVILVQAYVFTLLTAVFIGMAIHAHH